MKRDILFLCQFFYPEYNSSATLPFDTAKHLASSGFRVGALCGYPKEYSNADNVPVNEYKDGVKIKRLKYLQLKRSGRIGRLINYFSFTLSALLHIFEIKKYKSVIVYSNPPVLPLIAVLANKLYKTKIVFVAYDLYPEVAYASNSVKRGSIIDRVMKYINSRMYSAASGVVALSDEMKEFILNNRSGIDADKIAVIPNWAHEGSKAVDEADYSRFGYNPSQFIVSYFGNMGVCQDVETMLGAITQLKDNDEIQFLIVGHGNKKEYVEQRTRGYKNVKVLDFLTGDEFESALAISDCGIVSLENGLMGTCAPSKYYSYLQSGCAVFAVVEQNSYIAKEVKAEGIGYAFKIGDGNELAEVILNLSENREVCSEMKSNASELYKNRYSIEKAMIKYDELMKRVLN